MLDRALAQKVNVDLDITLCVLAQALLAAFPTRLGGGYATATPDTLQRRFLDSSGTITTTGDQVTVRIDRRAYSPVLRQANLPSDTTIPWWDGRASLRIQLTQGRRSCMEIRANMSTARSRCDGSTSCSCSRSATGTCTSWA